MLKYLDIGSENEETVLFIHGLGGNKENWDSQHELASGYRLIIPDLQGYGDSIVESKSTVTHNAKAVIELLKHLGLEKVHIVGLSMGGVITQEIYKQDKSKVKSMVLANTFSSLIPFNMNPFFTVYFKKEMQSKLHSEYFLERMAHKCLYKKGNKENRELLKKGAKIDKQAFKDSVDSCLYANYLCMLPLIDVPVYIIGSMYDEVIPPHLAVQTHALIPNSTLTILRDCGHVSNIEKKEEFNEIIYDFLKNIS